MDLSIDDIKEILLMSFLKQLDCRIFLDLVSETIELTGVDDFWDMGETAKLVVSELKPVISKIPTKQLVKISKQLKLDPKYVGAVATAQTAIDNIEIAECKPISIKMPQEIDDVVEALSIKSIGDILNILGQDGVDDLLLSTCEKYKKEILPIHMHCRDSM